MQEALGKYQMAEAVREAYGSGEDDETLEPRVLIDARGNPIGCFRDGDYIIFYNLRGEREVELCQSLLDKEFSHFPVERNLRLNMVTMIPYHQKLKARVAFSPEEEIRDTLSEILSRHGLRQVKVSESEKAIHVSFFLNGKNRKPFPGEERIAVPTPKGVAQFDQKPEMNACGVADSVIQSLQDRQVSFWFANFANIDVLGHIENEAAIRKAVEAVDNNLGRCLKAARQAGVVTMVTADHGTAEKWLYPDGTIDTGHTDSPVPFILVPPRSEGAFSWSLRSSGGLTDVAPTVLEVLDIPKPPVMTGQSLLLKKPMKKGSGENRVLLILLDGWGYRSETHGNLIAKARTPVMDDLQQGYPFTTLEASGEAVGLPRGTVGNSEAGHLHIGAGRRIFSDRLVIDRAIQDGTFFHNDAFLWAIGGARKEGKNFHLMGIVSFFSSHGSMDHLMALFKMAKQESVENLYHHAMLGRRGERKESGARYLETIEKELENLHLGRIVSVIGRYWSLDREENWDRIEKTYRMLVYGEGQKVRLRP
ncbi:MAG TPA: alkaline phosphatase family protein [Thermodesulfobacteriota bacterium]|nr:alkaline phosphatase family protein [Thermodesulfobacteriota bacterium]